MNKLIEMHVFIVAVCRTAELDSDSKESDENANHKDCCQFNHFFHAELSHSNDKMISSTAFSDAPAPFRGLAALSQCQ